MLVLTRKQFQKIRIGDDVVIKVIRTSKGSVKIGIEAPEDVRVMREEIYETGADRTRVNNRQLAELDQVHGFAPCSDQYPVPCSDQYPKVAV